MLKRFLIVLIGIGFAVSAIASGDRAIVVRKKTQTNPTIVFTGVAGNAELSKKIQRFINFCGWFDPAANGKNSDYTLKANANGSSVDIHLYRGETHLAGWRFSSSGNSTEVAKSVVDKVIEHVFEQLKVRGFCHSRIAFCAETKPGVRNIFTCDIDGGNMEQITNYATLNVEPCWSPNGRSICFSKYGKTGIDIVETTIAKPRKSRILTSFRGINTGSAISPDGQYMAVILSPDHHVDLYVVGMGKRYMKRLTKGIAVEASPCWSPDGTKIAFVSDSRGNPRIFIIDAKGGNLQMIPSRGIDAVTPSWSTDGKIAYATRLSRGANYVLAVYDLATGKNEIVSKGSGSWESPGWAADNRQVICKRTLNGKSSLWVVDTRTGRERELLHTGTELFDPSWSPCIKR